MKYALQYINNLYSYKHIILYSNIEGVSKKLVGWLIGFYGISTIVGYLIQNSVYTYILNIYNLQSLFVDNIFKQT